MTAKKAFLDAVEEGVARCLIPVPSAPLMALGEAVERVADDIESSARTMDADDRLNDVLIAADGLDGSFWPATHEGSREAIVNQDTVQSLADALYAYRDAEKERP